MAGEPKTVYTATANYDNGNKTSRLEKGRQYALTQKQFESFPERARKKLTTDVRHSVQKPSTLRAEVDHLTTVNQELQAQNADLLEQVSDLKTANAELEAQIEELKAAAKE